MTATRSTHIGRRALRWPVATFTLGALAVLVAAIPDLAERAQLDRTLAFTEPWRNLTGHLSHFSSAHLAYDLVVLIGLGLACEVRWPGRTRAALAVAVPAISAAVLIGAPQLETYRGLSGLDSVLLVFLATRLHVEGAFQSAWTKHLPLATVGAFMAKVLFEFGSGGAVFVDEAALFVPVPMAHLIGGLIGLFAATCPWQGGAVESTQESRAVILGARGGDPTRARNTGPEGDGDQKLPRVAGY